MNSKSVPWFAGVGTTLVVCSCLTVMCGCTKKDAVVADVDPDKGTPPPLAEAAQPDAAAVVVEVNGEKLTRAEVTADIDRALNYQRSRGMPENMLAGLRPRLEKQAVERFVGKTVLLAEARRREVEVSDAEVTAKLDEIKGRLPGGLTLDAAMQAQSMTIDDLKGDIVDDIKIRSVIDACTNNLPAPSEAEVATYYTNSIASAGDKERRARHILIKCEGTNAAVRATKKAEIEGYHKQLQEGADFAALAKEHSDCPSGQRGGDLGVIGRGQMVKQFEEAAFGQEVNAVGPVIETKFGYHIVQVVPRKTLAEAREELALQQKQTAVEGYVESLKSAADIKYAEGATAIQ